MNFFSQMEKKIVNNPRIETQLDVIWAELDPHEKNLILAVVDLLNAANNNKVTIGELADIKGDIKAGEVHIYGHVDGNVNSGRCHLNERAVVNGDITTNVLSMVEGARLSGRAEIG